MTQVLQQSQANTFLQAATQTGMKAQFDLPGFTATVLAPSDAAFATLLNGTSTVSWLICCILKTTGLCWITLEVRWYSSTA